MASSILALPPQIIGRILAFDDTSHMSLPLWLVGDHTLHRLLTQGVHFVELRNEKRFDVCFLPHFVESALPASPHRRSRSNGLSIPSDDGYSR